MALLDQHIGLAAEKIGELCVAVVTADWWNAPTEVLDVFSVRS